MYTRLGQLDIPVGPMPSVDLNTLFPEYIPGPNNTILPAKAGDIYPLSIPAPGMTTQQAQANALAAAGFQPMPPAVAQPAVTASSTAPAVATQSFSAWLNTGSNKIYLAAGGVLLVALAARKRRR